MTFAAEQSSLSSMLPLLVMVGLFALFMVFMSRQRKKQMAQQQAMLTALSPGTPIVLTSGFKGTVESVDGEDIRVELAPGAVVTVLKQAVLRVENGPASPQTPGDDLIDEADKRDDDDVPPPSSPIKDN